MKKINLLLAAMCFAFFLKAQTTAEFESLGLPTDSFWNGSDLSGGFSDGSGYFFNDYNATYDSWSGFSYSNKKDTVSSTYLNQYSAITSEGFYGSQTYVVGNDYGSARVRLLGGSVGKVVNGFYITNATYAYRVMQNGDVPTGAKKFGGTTGNDEDWFKLTAKGFLHGTMKANEVTFYLADFRSSNNAQDYIVNTWEWLDLSPLGNVDSLQFFLTSSDNGQFGMNTPAYFCLDNFTTSDVARTAPEANDDYVNITYLQDTIIDVMGNDINNGGTLTVALISAPQIPGAYATDTNGTHIFYAPATGIVTFDTLYYSLCSNTPECDTAMLVIDISSLQGLGEISDLTTQVTPNPFQNSLTVKISNQAVGISLYDVMGREVKYISSRINGEEAVINTENLASGVYFLKLSDKNSSQTVKVVRQ